MTDATQLRILHLYPRELGLNGDRGNVTVLLHRARKRGIHATAVEHEPGTGHLSDVDIVFIGSGPLSAQRAVSSDLLANAVQLRDLAAMGVPFLAISGGMQLLGTRIALTDGSSLEGASVLPISTTLTPQRSVGDIVVDTPSGVLVGYENHGSITELFGHPPLGRVRRGFGNAGPGGGEGVRVGDLIGTHLNGPVLALNPALADDILAAALTRRGHRLEPAADSSLRKLDEWASKARAVVV